MSTTIFFYLCEISTNIKLNLVIFGLCGLSFVVLYKFYLVVENVEPTAGALKFVRPKTYLSMLLIAVLIPSEKTMYLMAGSVVAQDIAKSEATQELSTKLMKAINKKLDEYTQEAK